MLLQPMGLINGESFLSYRFWRRYGRHINRKCVQLHLNQEKHHTQQPFKDEYMDFLKRFEIEHDVKYVFEWVDKQARISL
jgi:hypothetical protein